MKRVLLDVDGVLGDFLGGLLQKLRDLGVGAPDYNEIVEWDLIEHHLTDKQRLLAEDILHDWRFWDGLAPISGAVKAVSGLRANEFDVHFVTSPYKGCFGWTETRRDWLKMHFDAPYKSVHFSSDKSVYLGNVFVDDKPQNISDWQAAQNERGLDHYAFMFDQPYNRKFKWGTRLNGWSEDAVETIVQHVYRGA